MSGIETEKNYIYQPYGMQHKPHWEAGRIYGVDGPDLRFATVTGLTKDEARRVLAALDGESDPRLALLDEAVKALKALELQALQSSVNRPSNEWGMEALGMTRSVLARIDALEKGEGK
jgi:hypothetical protein